MNFTPDIALVGLLSSIVTEILKYIPFLKKNEITIALTSIVVTALGTWLAAPGGLSWENFIPALTFAFVSYKAVIQPTARTTRLQTQK